MTVPNPANHSPATDVEHDDAGCATCRLSEISNTAAGATSGRTWAPKLLPCPSWCIGDRAHRGEEISEMWDIRLHLSEDLLLIRKPVLFDGQVEERDLVSVCVACTDNTTEGTREPAGIQVNAADALTPDQAIELVGALSAGLRIIVNS